MFTIVGGDGKEYGPVTTDQVKNWIATGRASLDTKAKAAGTEEWRRLGDFPEFDRPTGAPPVIGQKNFGEDTLLAPATTADLAGRGARFGAATIDGVAIFLCRLPTTLIVWRLVAETISSGQQPAYTELVAAISEAQAKSYPYLIALMLVQGVLLTIRGQSLGKIVAGIRIVRYRDGSRAGFVHAFLLRGFLPGAIELIPFLGSLFWLVDVCFIFSDERRCLHDLIAGTKVVKAKT